MIISNIFIHIFLPLESLINVSCTTYGFSFLNFFPPVFGCLLSFQVKIIKRTTRPFWCLQHDLINSNDHPESIALGCKTEICAVNLLARGRWQLKSCAHVTCSRNIMVRDQKPPEAPIPKVRKIVRRSKVSYDELLSKIDAAVSCRPVCADLCICTYSESIMDTFTG